MADQRFHSHIVGGRVQVDRPRPRRSRSLKDRLPGLSALRRNGELDLRPEPAVTGLPMISALPLLSRELQHRIAPRLADCGFSFSMRRIEFARERGRFRDVVRFNVIDRSSVDACQLTSSWWIESQLYVERHREAWKQDPTDAVVAVSNDWLLPGWPRSSLGFRLMNEPEVCKAEMDAFYEGTRLVALPFLASVASLQSAAERALESEQTYRAAELLALSGQHARAVLLVDACVVEVGRRNLSGREVALRELRELRARLDVAKVTLSPL
jgi:hypothetical protein